MTDFAAENCYSTSGGVITERSGAGVGVDTVPAGAMVLMRNTGAVTHTVTLVNSQVADGLAVAARTVVLTTTQIKSMQINPAWGDANGRVNLWADVNGGATTEIKYYVLGGF